MENCKTEIEEEFGLICYLDDQRLLSYDQFMSWAVKRCEMGLFSQAYFESTSIVDAMEMLKSEYSAIRPSEEVLLSKIAEEYFSGTSNIQTAVGGAYELLNMDGNGTHRLSMILYSLVDDHSTETIEEFSRRANDIFIPRLEKHVGLYKQLYNRVFCT